MPGGMPALQPHREERLGEGTRLVGAPSPASLRVVGGKFSHGYCEP